MKTSQQQFELLITFMEEHVDLTKPSSNAKGRITALGHWQELTSLLNSDGSGDTKTMEKWRKVWSDYKNNTKKKAARLFKKNRGTALYKLSELEQRVLNIIGFEAVTRLESAEAGLAQVRIESLQPGTDEDRTDKNIQSWNEPGPSSRIHIATPCPSQAHSETHRRSEERIEPNSTSANNHDIPPLPSISAVSPHCVHIHEKSNESAGVLSNTPQPQILPAQYGQTPQRSERPAQQRSSPRSLNSQSRTVKSSRRLMRSQIRHTDQAAEQFLRSDSHWRAFRIQQHEDYIQIKRDRIRIREKEMQVQKDWQNIGLRALDILDKLVRKYCNE